jgi:hypothetical protein
LLDWKKFHSFSKLAFEKLYGNVTSSVSQSLRIELVFLEWCLETGLSEKIQFIDRVFHNRPDFVDMCQKTFEGTESMSKLIPVLQRVYNETTNRITKHKCFELLETFYLNGHKQKLLDLRLDFLIFQPEINLFLSVKDMKGDTWPYLKKEIVDTLKRAGRREDPALFYAWDGDHKGLFEFIRSSGSLSLLNQHVHIIYPHYSHQTIRLYKEFLGTYLEKHIGPRSSFQVNEVIKKLNQHGFQEAIREIKHYLNDKFEERILPVGIKTV